MLTLGIDSSAVAASAALVEDGKLLGEFYCNTKQVHSQTLLPMVEGLLQTVTVERCVSWTPSPFPMGLAPLRGCASASPV